MYTFFLGVIAGIIVSTAFFYTSIIESSIDDKYDTAQSNIAQDSVWMKPFKKLQNLVNANAINELRNEADFVNIEPEACVQTKAFHGGTKLITLLLNR